jgi:hypothetical protein
MNLKLICLMATPLLVILCSLLAQAQDYEIRLEKTWKAGDKYLLSATSTLISEPANAWHQRRAPIPR